MARQRCRMYGAALWGIAINLCIPMGPEADQLRYDTRAEWEQWRLPLGAVALSADGFIRPVAVRKDIDAVRDASRFGGGIRAAGSNQGEADLAIDGEQTTGWSPDPQDPPEEWWIEIDLGRGISARRVYLNFTEDAPPFELFTLFLSTGEQAVDVVGNVVPGSLIYRSQERFKENHRHQVVLELGEGQQVFQFLRLQVLKSIPGARLAEVEVEALGDNLALGLLEKGGGLEIILDVDNFGDAIPLGNALAIADGNARTMWFQHRRINRQVDVISQMTLDLGAVYWVDLVRLVGDIISSIGAYSRFNIDAYEVLTSDGSLAPDGTWLWHKQFAGRASNENHRLAMADHYFALTRTRYVRLSWVFWDAACAAACVGCGITPPCQFWAYTREFQVYGEGYPARVTFRSPLIDLSGDKQLNTIRWEAEAPPGTHVEVRSRTGDELIQHVTYYDKDGKEVTEKKWNKLIPSFRGPVDTTSIVGDDWSPWSNTYLTPGQPFQSPSPRRYLELEVVLASEIPQQTAILDYLEVEFSEPLAARTAGEIFPVEVLPGKTEEFSYFMRCGQTVGEGFDRLKVAASTPVRFRSAWLEGASVEAVVETSAAGFQITLPRSVHSGELVELRFDSAIFLQSTLFDVFLSSSQRAGEVEQRVEPGNATEQVESNTNVVRLPVSRGLLTNIALTSLTLTPNGDGRNDVLSISAALVNVLEARPLRLRVFDLSGRLLAETEQEVRAGRQEFTWDGYGADHRLVPPGLYMVQLQAKGDAHVETFQRVVSVVY